MSPKKLYTPNPRGFYIMKFWITKLILGAKRLFLGRNKWGRNNHFWGGRNKWAELNGDESMLHLFLRFFSATVFLRLVM